MCNKASSIVTLGYVQNAMQKKCLVKVDSFITKRIILIT